MKFDFETIIDRTGTNAFAIEGVCDPATAERAFAGAEVPQDADLIPMWVADMNFATCPTIPEEMIRRAQHPLYGYFIPDKEYCDSIIRWHETRNGVTGLCPKHIGYENSVIGGVISAVNALCSRGDNILIHAPTYIGFQASLADNGYHMIFSDLIRDEAGIWRMDFEDMEKKIVENHIHTAVFCSPHNPTGRVWELWEIEKFMALCKKYEVYVVSDEIWSDILLNGHKHIPVQSVSEDARNRTVAVYAPSKTFNLAGLIGSYHIIYNDWLRDRVEKEGALSHYNNMNVMSMHALIGAYKPEGYVWVDELCQVLTENVNYACEYIKRNFEGIDVCHPEGTYMLYLNCTEWCRMHGKTIDEVQQAGINVGVLWQDGRAFGTPNSIRMNLALPLSRVQEAFDRLDKYVFNA